MLRRMNIGLTLLLVLTISVFVLPPGACSETIYFTCPDTIRIEIRAEEPIPEGWKSRGRLIEEAVFQSRDIIGGSNSTSMMCVYSLKTTVVSFEIFRYQPADMTCTEHVINDPLGFKKIQNQFKCERTTNISGPEPRPVTTDKAPKMPTK